MLRPLLAALLALAWGCAGAPKGPVIPAPPDEAALMAKIRAEVKSAPQAALEESEEAERRFGESPLAEERRALAIDALINLQRIGAARDRAGLFLQRYPNGPFSAHVQAMTGAHATSSGPDPAKPHTCPCENR